MKIKNVGVVGCGQMGGGIAQVCAQAGYNVLVSEVNEELLVKGLRVIRNSLDKAAARGKITQENSEVIYKRITSTTRPAEFKDCDLVIEAAKEDINLKKRIFREIDTICPPQTIFATNTSCLSIAEIAASTGRGEKVVGIHFFNPPPVMKLLEIVCAQAASTGTIETAKAFGESLGKTVIIAQDRPGFIVNRLMVPQLLNAIRLVEAGEATKEDIDTGMTLGLNQPLGPLALADLIGLDTVLAMADGIFDKIKETQYIAPSLLKEMVASGRLGRKTGKGFFDYA